MREEGHVYDMMGRDADFYRDLFASLDNNAVLRKRNAQGVYVPVSCTREFTQMMECTAEDFIELFCPRVEVDMSDGTLDG